MHEKHGEVPKGTGRFPKSCSWLLVVASNVEGKRPQPVQKLCRSLCTAGYQSQTHLVWTISFSAVSADLLPFSPSHQKHVFTSPAMHSLQYIRDARRASCSPGGTRKRGEVRGLGFFKLCLSQYLVRVFSVWLPKAICVARVIFEKESRPYDG